MTDEQLAYEIAKGIGTTGIEGNYGSVSCSTAGDYPSMGISQWEGLGGRGDDLLSLIPGSERFIGHTYGYLHSQDMLGDLSSLLSSPEGQEAQNRILAQDCLLYYVPSVKKALENERCIIYAGMWCPTSHKVVRRFLQNRADDFDLNDLEVLHELFRDAYYIAADVGDQYAEGYANRANLTYDYVTTLETA